ncbi:MAG: HlyD family efflux transporter periplasmic adaptor subunit [Phycisphaeraceae bacterium]|nr:HlyD family efflux transporter periplasmic adaptor subunit [Phycisphaeraceae bacterium]
MAATTTATTTTHRPPRTLRNPWLSRRWITSTLGLLILAALAAIAFIPVDRWASGPGYVNTDDEAELRPSVEGAIDKVYAHSGDLIAEGQPLIQLRSRIQQAAYEQAASELEARKAQLKQTFSVQELSTAQRKEQIFQAEQSLALAQSQFDRMKDAMSHGGGFSPKEVDDARLKVELAQSRLVELRLSREKVDSEQLEVLREQIEASEKNLALRKAELDARIITAPLKGNVYFNRFEPGEVVKPEHVLGQVFDPTRWVVKFKLQEHYVGRVEKGQPVKVSAAAFNPYIHGYLDATVSRIIPVVTPQPNGGGIFYAEAILKQPTRFPVQPGMTATAYVNLGRTSLLFRWLDGS